MASSERVAKTQPLLKIREQLWALNYCWYCRPPCTRLSSGLSLILCCEDLVRGNMVSNLTGLVAIPIEGWMNQHKCHSKNSMLRMSPQLRQSAIWTGGLQQGIRWCRAHLCFMGRVIDIEGKCAWSNAPEGRETQWLYCRFCQSFAHWLT